MGIVILNAFQDDVNGLVRRDFLDWLEFAEPAACAFGQCATGIVQHAYNVDAAQLVERCLVRKAVLKFQARAALRQRIAIDFPARHVEINGAVIDNFSRSDLRERYAAYRFTDGANGRWLLFCRRCCGAACCDQYKRCCC